MIKKTIEDAINKQIVREIYSSNLYLSISAYFHNQSLDGFANWMRVQAQEEMVHAMKFFDFVLDRQGLPKIGTIEAPPTDFKNPITALESAYQHEQLVSSWINELSDLAAKESDHATVVLLQWYITEQVEEEATSSQLVDKVKMIGDNKAGLFLLDNELKQRKFTPIP